MLRVYNTLTRKKEFFSPLLPPDVKFYLCGITPYDSCHIGHARCYVAFDTIRRYLQYLGYNVYLVQNITDIDDKIIARAAEENSKIEDITERYIQEYNECASKLNILAPSVSPKVTEHIKDIIEFIKVLLEKGYAYITEDNDVYFDVRKAKNYGKLSKRSLQEAARYYENKKEEYSKFKRHPADFALWKAAKRGEPSWSSPWGAGRPGWHVECSTLASKYLGECIDIHGGGSDLVFPHHENELCQSEAYWGKPHVKYFFHSGYLTIEGEKMSKSKSNFFPLKELLEEVNPEVLRFYLLLSKYNSFLEFEEEKLKEASRAYYSLVSTLDFINYVLKTGPQEQLTAQEEREFLEEINSEKKSFFTALDDDFNTPSAIAAIFRMQSVINVGIVARKLPKELLYKVKEEFVNLLQIIGLFYNIPKSHVSPEVKLLVELLLWVREELRENKLWDLADQIRSRLRNYCNIHLQDTTYGTRWFIDKGVA